MKYPLLILATAIGALAVAPPPPPPPDVTASPAPAMSAVAPTPATSAAPATQASPDVNERLNNLFGKPAATAAPKGAAPKGTPSPPPNARKGLDGVWELQIQRGANTEYEHFNLKQVGNTVTGTYLTQSKKKYPLAGSVDGRNIRMVISLSDGSTILLEGRLDGTTDMLGMMTDPKERVPFTAAYRPKEKWIDNLNASPAGNLGGIGSGGIGGGP